MSRLFISHSSHDNNWALALRDWLVAEGWGHSSDIFLDIDPEGGISAGQTLAASFRQRATRCEAVLVLISQNGWLRLGVLTSIIFPTRITKNYLRYLWTKASVRIFRAVSNRTGKLFGSSESRPSGL